VRERLAERLRLYVVTDRGLSRGRSEEEVVRAAVAGGATAIQLRGKDWSGRDLVAVGRKLRAITREAGVLFFVNDRVDVALAVEADGAHLGQEDLPLPDARRIMGPEPLIGITVQDEHQAREAEAGGADYLGTSAVFPTTTKVSDVPPLGLEVLEAIARAVRIPVVAIGGIGPHNAAEAVRRGAAGVAVVSAVVAAEDVTRAARELRATVDAALAGRG
jgi:thiamine-phosphate pyrophosphorylase